MDRIDRLNWHPEDGDEARRANAVTVGILEGLVHTGDRDGVLQALKGWSPSELMSVMLEMRTKRARRLFEWLPDDIGMPVLVQIDPELRGVLYAAASHSKFHKLIARLPRDKALELLEALPEDVAHEIAGSRSDAQQVRRALAAYEDSAEAEMRHGVLMAPQGSTVGDVLTHLRARAEDIARVDMVFVIDAGGRPVGYLRPRDLLLNDEAAPVAGLMHPDPAVVSAAMDREEVLALAEAHDANMVGVVDDHGRLIGGIAPPELAEILRAEATEDLLKLGGVSPDTTQFDGPVQIVRRRLPWLLGGLIGASIAAMGIAEFADALAESAILASFIPVVLATAGNVGIQASTVSVQILTSGAEWHGDLFARFRRELGGALLNGSLVGLAVAMLVMLATLVLEIRDPGLLGLTAMTALTVVTVVAASVGTFVPFVLRSFGLDPAAATGIFITTSNDVFGVLTFFAIAEAIYL